MRCSVCGEAIDVNAPVIWEEIIGWTKKSSTAVKLKKQTGAVMCAVCMVKTENGMPQATLFDELGSR